MQCRKLAMVYCLHSHLHVFSALIISAVELARKNPFLAVVHGSLRGSLPSVGCQEWYTVV